MGHGPNIDDLIAVSAFASLFDQPDFVPGEWIQPETHRDGVIETGWWSVSETVAAWERALYEHDMDPDSDYLTDPNVEFVNRAIGNPKLLASTRLPSLRRALTFLARAERHTGGWYEEAFKSGMAQAATRRPRGTGRSRRRTIP